MAKEVVYVTAYFQTKGIVEAEVNQSRSWSAESNHVCVSWPGWAFPRTITIGRDCFKTFEEAQKDCEKRRAKEVKATQAKLKKLESMKFDTANKIEKVGCC